MKLDDYITFVSCCTWWNMQQHHIAKCCNGGLQHCAQGKQACKVHGVYCNLYFVLQSFQRLVGNPFWWRVVREVVYYALVRSYCVQSSQLWVSRKAGRWSKASNAHSKTTGQHHSLSNSQNWHLPYRTLCKNEDSFWTSNLPLRIANCHMLHINGSFNGSK